MDGLFFLGLLKQHGEEGNADAFFPLLIYSILQTNPPHLISNLQYISRFRNPTKLQSESGYYLTHMFSAVSFLENLDHTVLSITKEEFDAKLSQQIQEWETQHIVTPSKPKSSKSTEEENEDSNSPIKLENLAKKPLEMLSKWFQEAAQVLTNDSRSSTPEETVTPPLPPRSRTASTPLVSQSLSAEENAILADYDLQLAMAISASLEQEKKEMELVMMSTEFHDDASKSISPELLPQANHAVKAFSVDDSAALANPMEASHHEAGSTKSGEKPESLI
jgi:hypothetical protein